MERGNELFAFALWLLFDQRRCDQFTNSLSFILNQPVHFEGIAPNPCNCNTPASED
jgi:hypothetical protein